LIQNANKDVMNIYVGNLPFTITEDKLKDLFVGFDKVARNNLIAGIPRWRRNSPIGAIALWSRSPPVGRILLREAANTQLPWPSLPLGISIWWRTTKLLIHKCNQRAA
jgi:RNA recognition motif-containing protein